MAAPRPHTVPQHRFAWLLWLALLLPLAQGAAAWHALSHARVDTSGEADGKQALHGGHCDLCMVAAVVSGGALPGHPPVLSLAPARHESPQSRPAPAWLAVPAHAYRSRAPPFASH